MRWLCLAGAACVAVPAAAQPGVFEAPPGDVGGGPQAAMDVEHDTGWMIGASLGRGAMDISCPRCGDNSTATEAVSIAGQLGFRFGPRWGITGDVWVLEYAGSYWFQDPIWQTAWRVSATVGPQVWVTERLWVRAGMGPSRHWVDPGLDHTSGTGVTTYASPARGGTVHTTGPGSIDEVGLASHLGAGFELLGDRDFAVDVQLRSGVTLTQRGWNATSAALAFGVSWF